MLFFSFFFAGIAQNIPIKRILTILLNTFNHILKQLIKSTAILPVQLEIWIWDVQMLIFSEHNPWHIPLQPGKKNQINLQTNILGKFLQQMTGLQTLEHQSRLKHMADFVKYDCIFWKIRLDISCESSADILHDTANPVLSGHLKGRPKIVVVF